MVSKHRPLTIIFFTVFIDLIGFGMVIPLSPYLGREYGATAFEVGLLLSVYSLMQILFSPIWGRWSDRIGRRPIIIVSLLGTGLSHFAFAFSGALWMLFISRTLSGIFGANISTAMAYAADVTDPKERSKGIGILGAAFGLGFILGPFFGGLLADVGSQLGTQPPYGHSFPALMAAVLCFANVFFAFFFLNESLPVEKRANLPPRQSKLQSTMEYFSRPVVGPLLLVCFLASFSMSQMEATLFLLVKDRFDLSLSTASIAFAYVGIVIALTQGVLLRKILPFTGERKLMVLGTLLSGAALFITGFVPTILMLALVMTIMSLGFGLRMPSLNGSLSLTCSPQEQGTIMGVNQSLQALGRILGPPLGGWLYGAFGAELNFAISGFFGLLGLGVIWRIYESIPDTVGKVKTEIGYQTSRPQTQTFTPQSSAVVPGFKTTTDTPKPVIIERPTTRNPEPPKVEHIRKEDRITIISAFQFRSLFTNNVNFLFFDLRPIEAAPQYSRAIRTTGDEVINELPRRTQDKRSPILILCEDGVVSKEIAKRIADLGYVNVVIVDGGARALNKTGHV